jgi:hypothetical protein
MSILDQAEDLRKQAIALLVGERQTIDERLAQLGYQNGESIEKENRKPKTCGRCGAAGHTVRTCIEPTPST